jgi:hypothetical protein
MSFIQTTEIYDVTITQMRERDAFGALSDGTRVWLGNHICATQAIKEGDHLKCYLETSDQYDYPRVSRVAYPSELGVVLDDQAQLRRLYALVGEQADLIADLEVALAKAIKGRARPGQPKPTRKSPDTLVWHYPKKGGMVIDREGTLQAIGRTLDEIMELSWGWPRGSVEQALRQAYLSIPGKKEKMTLSAWHEQRK